MRVKVLKVEEGYENRFKHLLGKTGNVEKRYPQKEANKLNVHRNLVELDSGEYCNFSDEMLEQL